MRTRKILTLLAVLVMTFVACFAVGCGSVDAKIGGEYNEAAVAKAQELIDSFIEKNKKNSELTIPFSVKDTSKVITVTQDGFNTAEFGSYQGTGDYESMQEQYVQALVTDLFATRQGRVPTGRIILLNYGTRADETTGYFIYIGNKQFVQLYAKDSVDCKDSLIPKLFYVPTGYRLITCNHKGGGAYLLRVLEKVTV